MSDNKNRMPRHIFRLLSGGSRIKIMRMMRRDTLGDGIKVGTNRKRGEYLGDATVDIDDGSMHPSIIKSALERDTK